MALLSIVTVSLSASVAVDLPRHVPGSSVGLAIHPGLVLLLLAPPDPLPDEDPRRPKPTPADVEAVAKEAQNLAKELDKQSEYLFNALLSPDEKVRLKAAQALGKLGTRAMGSRMTETLLHVIQTDPSPAVRAEMVPLVRFADFPGARDTILAALKDLDPIVRRLAANWLAVHRSWPDVVVPALAQALTTSLTSEETPAEQQYRLAVFGAIAAHRHLAAEADSALVQALKARRWEDRREAFVTLTRVRKDKATLVPLFKERFAAKDPEDPELWAAVVSVHELGPLAEPFVPDLVQCLKYGLYKANRNKINPYVDYLSPIREFDQLGPVAKAAAPDLLKVFFDRTLWGRDRTPILSAYSAVATPNRDDLKRIADEVVTHEIAASSANKSLVEAIRRLGPALMPHIAEAWKRQLGDRELSHHMLWLCWRLRGDAAPLLPIVESFFVEPAANNPRRDPDGLDRLARQAAKVIRDDPGPKAGLAPKK